MNLKKTTTLFCFAALAVVASATQQDNQRVAAKVSVTATANGAMKLSVEKEKLCSTYSMQLFTADIAARVGDGVIPQYFANQKVKKQTQNIKNIPFIQNGFYILPQTKYTMLTLAYDKDGNPGLVTRTDFTTPQHKYVGNPKLKCIVTAIGPDSVTVKFSPNKDVAGYAICQFEAGTIDSLVKKHGPMLGFSNPSDMIRRFSGKGYAKEYAHTWDKMIPDYKYEICALPWDKDGVYLNIISTPVKTHVLGGNGRADVTIEVGEFGGSAETGFFQEIIYTPNNQAALHRDIIITEEGFNNPEMGEQGVIKMLQKEIPQDPNWNQYRVDRAKWNAQPNTVYIACAMAKNAKGEWSKLITKKFKTPEK